MVKVPCAEHLSEPRSASSPGLCPGTEGEGSAGRVGATQGHSSAGISATPWEATAGQGESRLTLPGPRIVSQRRCDRLRGRQPRDRNQAA